MDELAGVLARERRLLEKLLFKLVETSQLLEAGEHRFLLWAASEVERTARRASEGELLRAALVERLAASLATTQGGDGADGITLRRLTADSPVPYRSIFDDHRRGLIRLVSEVGRVAGTVESLAQAGLRGLRIQTSSPASNRRGLRALRDGPEPRRRVLVTGDVEAAEAEVELARAEAGYRAVLAAASGLELPALIAFLR